MCFSSGGRNVVDSRKSILSSSNNNDAQDGTEPLPNTFDANPHRDGTMQRISEVQNGIRKSETSNGIKYGTQGSERLSSS